MKNKTQQQVKEIIKNLSKLVKDHAKVRKALRELDEANRKAGRENTI